VRIGRDLVVMGAPYAKWQALQARNVAGYEIAPNRESQPAAPDVCARALLDQAAMKVMADHPDLLAGGATESA
jgi:hypothetical protein